jgi:hypothetical protein
MREGLEAKKHLTMAKFNQPIQPNRPNRLNQLNQLIQLNQLNFGKKCAG